MNQKPKSGSIFSKIKMRIMRKCAPAPDPALKYDATTQRVTLFETNMDSIATPSEEKEASSKPSVKQNTEDSDLSGDHVPNTEVDKSAPLENRLRDDLLNTDINKASNSEPNGIESNVSNTDLAVESDTQIIPNTETSSDTALCNDPKVSNKPVVLGPNKKVIITNTVIKDDSASIVSDKNDEIIVLNNETIIETSNDNTISEKPTSNDESIDKTSEMDSKPNEGSDLDVNTRSIEKGLSKLSMNATAPLCSLDAENTTKNEANLAADSNTKDSIIIAEASVSAKATANNDSTVKVSPDSLSLDFESKLSIMKELTLGNHGQFIKQKYYAPVKPVKHANLPAFSFKQKTNNSDLSVKSDKNNETALKNKPTASNLVVESNTRNGAILTADTDTKVSNTREANLSDTSSSDSSDTDTELSFPDLKFHRRHADNILVPDENCYAVRLTPGTNKGHVFSESPVSVNQKIRLRVLSIFGTFDNHISLGFLTVSPDSLPTPIPDYHPAYKTMIVPIPKPYNNLDIVHYYLNPLGQVHYGINGIDKGMVFCGMDLKCDYWAMVKLCGKHMGVILEKTIDFMNVERNRLINEIAKMSTKDEESKGNTPDNDQLMFNRNCGKHIRISGDGLMDRAHDSTTIIIDELNSTRTVNKVLDTTRTIDNEVDNTADMALDSTTGSTDRLNTTTAENRVLDNTKTIDNKNKIGEVNDTTSRIANNVDSITSVEYKLDTVRTTNKVLGSTTNTDNENSTNRTKDLNKSSRDELESLSSSSCVSNTDETDTDDSDSWITDEETHDTAKDITDVATRSTTEFGSLYEIGPLDGPLKFHRRVHGENIKIFADGARAKQGGLSVYCGGGQTFSSRPVRIGEKIYLRVVEAPGSFYSIWLGFVTQNPLTFSNEIPINCMYYRNSYIDKKIFKKGNILSYHFNPAGDVHCTVNGESIYIDFSLSEIDLASPVWAFVEIIRIGSIVELCDLETRADKADEAVIEDEVGPGTVASALDPISRDTVGTESEAVRATISVSSVVHKVKTGEENATSSVTTGLPSAGSSSMSNDKPTIGASSVFKFGVSMEDKATDTQASIVSEFGSSMAGKSKTTSAVSAVSAIIRAETSTAEEEKVTKTIAGAVPIVGSADKSTSVPSNRDEVDSVSSSSCVSSTDDTDTDDSDSWITDEETHDTAKDITDVATRSTTEFASLSAMGPPDGPLKFHSQVHGKNVKISADGSRVTRERQHNLAGQAFSSRPVRIGEKVCLRVVEDPSHLAYNWLGFVIQDPLTFINDVPATSLYYRISRINNRLFKKGNILSYHLDPAGDVHCTVNGESIDIDLSLLEFDLKSPVWAYVEINGIGSIVEFWNPNIQMDAADEAAIASEDSVGSGTVASTLDPISRDTVGTASEAVRATMSAPSVVQEAGTSKAGEDNATLDFNESIRDEVDSVSSSSCVSSTDGTDTDDSDSWITDEETHDTATIITEDATRSTTEFGSMYEIGPPDGPLKFHRRVHGENIKISADGARAKITSRSYRAGQAFSSRPVGMGEKVCLRVVEAPGKFDQISLGFFTQNPLTFINEIPEYCTCDRILGIDKRFYKTGNILTYQFDPTGEIHGTVNGESIDIKLYLLKTDMASPIWAYVRITGSRGCVEFWDPMIQTNRADEVAIPSEDGLRPRTVASALDPISRDTVSTASEAVRATMSTPSVVHKAGASKMSKDIANTSVTPLVGESSNLKPPCAGSTPNIFSPPVATTSGIPSPSRLDETSVVAKSGVGRSVAVGATSNIPPLHLGDTSNIVPPGAGATYPIQPSPRFGVTSGITPPAVGATLNIASLRLGDTSGIVPPGVGATSNIPAPRATSRPSLTDTVIPTRYNWRVPSLRCSQSSGIPNTDLESDSESDTESLGEMPTFKPSLIHGVAPLGFGSASSLLPYLTMTSSVPSARLDLRSSVPQSSLSSGVQSSSLGVPQLDLASRLTSPRLSQSSSVPQLASSSGVTSSSVGVPQPVFTSMVPSSSLSQISGVPQLGLNSGLASSRSGLNPDIPLRGTPAPPRSTENIGPLRFDDEIHGMGISIRRLGVVARVVKSPTECGFAFSSRSVRANEKIYLRLFDIPTTSPSRICFGFAPSYLVAQSRTITLSSSNMALLPIRHTQNDNILSYYYNSDGNVYYSINGLDMGLVDIPSIDLSEPRVAVYLEGVDTAVMFLDTTVPHHFRRPNQNPEDAQLMMESIRALSQYDPLFRPISRRPQMEDKPSLKSQSVQDEPPSSQIPKTVKECVICMDRPVDSVLYKCGHMCMCFMCAMQVWHDAGGKCPICRVDIEDVVRPYQS